MLLIIDLMGLELLRVMGRCWIWGGVRGVLSVRAVMLSAQNSSPVSTSLPESTRERLSPLSRGTSPALFSLVCAQSQSPLYGFRGDYLPPSPAHSPFLLPGSHPHPLPRIYPKPKLTQTRPHPRNPKFRRKQIPSSSPTNHDKSSHHRRSRRHSRYIPIFTGLYDFGSSFTFLGEFGWTRRDVAPVGGYSDEGED